MTSLSLAMIVKNEAATITGVLQDAAAFCDELVVVDTGSTDDTVALATAAGARVEHFAWVDDFAAARNASFRHCTGDWVLWLDADDRVPPASQRAFAQLRDTVLQGDDLDAVYLPYRYHFSDDGEVCTWSFPRERLLRRGAGLLWANPVHEVITVPEHRSTQRDEPWVEHRPLPEAKAGKTGRNLRILQTAYDGGDRSLRTLFYFGNELADNGRDLEALDAYAGFLAGAPLGWERHAALLAVSKANTRLGRHDLAAQAAHDAIREDPTRAEAFVLAGLQHYHAERWAQAVPYFVAATSLTPPTDGFVAVRDYSFVPWDYLSICLHRLGRQQEALEALVRAVEGNPDRERLTDNAGWILKAW